MSFEKHQQKLDSELATITKELEQIASLNPQTGDWMAVPDPSDLSSADPNVEADGVEEWNERRAAMAQLEIRYRNIRRALDKIASNTYGICEISGEAIEDERLVANPAARTNLANIDREAELPI